MKRSPEGTDRRHFMQGIGAAAGGVLVSGLVSEALAQGAEATLETAAAPWRKLNGLIGRAQKLGLSAPRMSAGVVTGSSEFGSVMPAVVDFIKGVDGGPKGRAASVDVEAVLDEATELAIEVSRADHPPSSVTRSIAAPGAPLAKAPSFDDIKKDYETSFANAKIIDKHRSNINWCVKQILDNKDKYLEVEDACCTPWFAVAIIHGMECSFNFRQHLHNGDNIKKKTWQVPSGRPDPWNPPNDWNSSAIDALRIDKLTGLTDWSLARTLYRWELYNGWGTRSRGIKTPYLWSFSDQYSKGKYVADGKWDSDAVSQQCGAAVMLKVLVEKGEIAFV